MTKVKIYLGKCKIISLKHIFNITLYINNMSFTFDFGIPIAKIIHSDKKLKQKPIVYLDTDKKGMTSYPAIQLKVDDMFEPTINTETERTILYVTGASGSGKSYFTRQYAEEYHRKFPKNEIILLSSINEDSSIDKIPDLIRINVKNPNFLKDEFSIDDFKDKLVIFDDTDCITDKAIKKQVNGIRDIILETGRHTNTSCIFTSHLACAGHETKRILNEAHGIVFFPASLNGKTLKYLIEGYMGFDKNQSAKIKNFDTRWVCVLKHYPQVILTQKLVCLAKDL